MHGDLKPSNLLLRAPGDVVLADFGAAELTGGARASTGRRGGTPLYFAPEQFHGAPSSPAADLYAVGAILWEAATGRPLRSHADLMRGARRRRPLPPTAARQIEARTALRLLRLLVVLLGDVPARTASSVAAAATA